MSATLDAAPVAGYLGGDRRCSRLRSEGRQYPLEIEYTPHSAAPLEEQVAAALERLAARGVAGTRAGLSPRRGRDPPRAVGLRRPRPPPRLALLPLHGDQSPEEQDRAVAPSARTKVILSTNVAESSITIEGVAAVIDSGLARVASHSPWSGLPALQVARISQASANQRAGRAGRTGPGRAIRLYPQEDFVRRPAQDVPEILRADLAPAALLLHAMGLRFRRTWSGSTRRPPPPSTMPRSCCASSAPSAARSRCRREMARYPLHPRLARLVVEARAARRGRGRRRGGGAAQRRERLPPRCPHATRSDLLVLLEGEWAPRAAQVVRQVRRIGERTAGSAPAR